MQDPELVLKILRSAKMAKAIFNQAEKLGLYQDRYLKKFGGVYVNEQFKKNLSPFLSTWLHHLPEKLEVWD